MRELNGLTDEEQFSIAAEEERVFLTFDVKDFAVIVRRWAESRREHAGCAIVAGIDHGGFGVILDSIAGEPAARHENTGLTDLTLFLAS
jgi:hypothetical protein